MVEDLINEAMFDSYDKWRTERQYPKGHNESTYLDAWERGRRFENERLTLHLSETQKKLDSAVKVIEHYAGDETWACSPTEYSDRYVHEEGYGNGNEVARKWLDAEQGGGE